MRQAARQTVAGQAAWPRAAGMAPGSTAMGTVGVLTTAALVFFIAQSFGRLGDVFPVLQPLHLGILSQVGFAFVLLNRQSQQWLISAVSHPSVVAVMALAILAVVTVPGGAWPTASVQYLTGVYYNSILLFAAGILAFAHRKTRRAVIVAGVILAIYTAAKPFLFGFVGRYSIGYTYDPNVTAAYLVMLVPWAAAWAAIERNARWKWIPLVAIPVLVLSVVRTGSRGGLLGLVMLLPFLYGIAPPRRRVHMVLLTTLAAGAFAFVAREELASLRTVLFDKADYNYDHIDGRVAVWTRGMGYVREHPVQGHGINGFRYRELEWKIANLGGGKETAAHNMYLEVAVDLGVPGLVAFLAACIAALRGVVRVRRAASQRFRATLDPGDAEVAVLAGASAASLLSIMATGFFLSLAHQAPVYYAWSAAVGLAVAEKLGGHRLHTTAVPAAAHQAGNRGNGRGWRSWRSEARWKQRPGTSTPTW